MPGIPRPQVPPRSLQDLLAAFPEIQPGTATAVDTVITGATLDSRRVQPGDVYAALPGFTTHGARFAAEAVEAGAVALLTDAVGAELVAQALAPADGPAARPSGPGAPAVLVAADPRGILGPVSDWVYGHPSRQLRVIGITGTNGKTTISHLIADALAANGAEVGLIGTLGTRIGSDYLPTVRTTPESPDVHALLALMLQRGATAVLMEVSSHALRLGRVDGVVFEQAVFTNLTQDHLDFHADMDDYFAAKCELFRPERAKAALVCVDDEWGQRLIGIASRAGLADIQSYAGVTSAGGVTEPASASEPITITSGGDGSTGTRPHWSAADVRLGPLGSEFVVVAPDGTRQRARSPLAGDFNVTNSVGAIAAVVHAGVPLAEAAAGVGAAPGVPGRMEHVDAGQPFLAIVDYAHTPDAVDHVLAAVRRSVRGRVICVVGCGGDRDREKRGPMGAAAAERSDIVVITDDNPRSEDPAAIRAAVLAGAAEIGGDFVEIGDRAEAIACAARLAGKNDAVVVLGKGHEVGQEVAGVVTPFDDRIVLAQAIQARSDAESRATVEPEADS